MASKKSDNPFDKLLDSLDVSGKSYKFYNLKRLEDPRYGMFISRIIHLRSP